MDEKQRFLTALAEVVDQSAIDGWLETPNAALGNATPNELIERSHFDRLWEMILRLRAGEPV